MDLVSSRKQVVFYIKSQNQSSYYLENRTLLKNLIFSAFGSVSTLKLDLSQVLLFIKVRLVQAVILLSEGVRFMVQNAVVFNFVPTS